MTNWIDVETNRALIREREIKVMRDKQQTTLFEHGAEVRKWVSENIRL